MPMKARLLLTGVTTCFIAVAATPAEAAATADEPAAEEQARQTEATPSAPTLAAADVTGTVAEDQSTGKSAEAESQSYAQSGSPSGWEVNAILYGWLASTHMKIHTPQGERIEVDQSFGDV